MEFCLKTYNRRGMFWEKSKLINITNVLRLKLVLTPVTNVIAYRLHVFSIFGSLYITCYMTFPLQSLMEIKFKILKLKEICVSL